MSITAEGSSDPYIGGLNFKITASLLLGNYKGNCQVGAYLSGNTKNENSLTLGAFGGLYIYGNGVSVRSFQNEFMVGTTTSLHLNLSRDAEDPVTATIYRSVTSVGNTGQEFETFGGSLSVNNNVHEPGLMLSANKTLPGDYKFHLTGKLGSNISVIGEVIDLFGDKHVTGGISISENFFNNQ